MARKRRSDSEQGVSLDSLMDALTNVVAVLILVLILVQADVSKKVEQFLDDMKPATPEEVQEARQQVARLEDQRDRREKLLETDSPKPEVLEAERRNIALLEKKIANNQNLLADLAEVRDLEQKLRKERDAEKEKTDALQDEIARLEALLDTTPEKIAKPDVVTIPSSRPIPEFAKVYYALVFNDRVHLIDPFTPLAAFEKEVRSRKSGWIAGRAKGSGGEVDLHDAKKVFDHFANFDFGNRRGQKVRLTSKPHQTTVRLEIIPDKANGGTTPDELRKPGSDFEQAMRSLARIPGAVVLFRVNPNSFSTYLLARPITDAANIPAGWEVSLAQSYEMVIPNFRVKPTAPAPKPPSTPPKGSRPPRLAPVVD